MKKLVCVILLGSLCLAGIWWFLRDDSRMTLQLENMRINSVAFSPDGKTLAGVGFATRQQSDRPLRNAGLIRLWDMATGQEQLTIDNDLLSQPESVAFSPDGKTLATTGGPGGGLLWNARTGKLLALLESGYNGITFAPDGMSLAAGGDNHASL